MAGVTYSANITGAEAASRKFGRLDRAAQTTIARRAVRAGLKPQLRRAKSTTQFADQTGSLRRSLTTSVRRGRQRGTTVGRVKTSDSKKAGVRRFRFTGVPLEYGHRIAVSESTRKTEAKHVLDRIGKDRRQRRSDQFRAVSAGFVQPRPFMRDAFRSSVGDAERQFTAEFVASVNREVAGA